jgi:hypothetical protein
MKHSRLVTILFFSILATGNPGIASPVLPDSSRKAVPDGWAYNILNIVRQKALPGTVVKVAVIDDGFRLSHKTLKNFIYTNKKEVPENFHDDDQNGFIDDVHGWDISDNDPDISVPKGKENTYYHGTYIAGIIVSVFQKCYGDDASGSLQIIPVKVLSDHARSTYFEDAYKGIKYACDMGADIICCAWSGGQFSDEEKSILGAVLRKGTIVIGAAGNFSTEKAEPPSSYPGVYCVASLDTLLHKSRFSNYGMRIDIAAPGDSVYGPHPLADNAFIHENGTSPSTAIITGCVAILKAQNPKSSAKEIFEAISNTARPVDSINLKWCGKLGAGLPDVSKANEYLQIKDYRYVSFSPSRSKGKITYRKKKSRESWNIRPAGAYQGIHLQAASTDPRKTIKLHTPDSLWYRGPIAGLSKWTYIPGSEVKIELSPETGLPKDLELNYYMETIDSTKLYCNELIETYQNEGVITDGSGDNNYANNCSCKWQISVPANKRIRIEFTSIDTQPNTDFIWLFDGTATLQENLLAKFSGTNQPPVVTTFTNKVLIWFLTDKDSSGKGWSMTYSAVDQ